MSASVGQVVFLLLVLVLPLSALVARRVPLGTTAKYAAAWVAVFLILWLIARRFT